MWLDQKRKTQAADVRAEKVDDPTEAFSDKNKISEVLIVRGLKGQEHIRFDVDPRKTENANEEARKLADAGFRRK